MKKLVKLYVFLFLSFKVWCDKIPFILLNNIDNSDIEINTILYFDTNKDAILNYGYDTRYSLNNNSNSVHIFEKNLMLKNCNFRIPKTFQNTFWFFDYYFDLLETEDYKYLSDNESYYHPENEYVLSQRDNKIPWYEEFVPLCLEMSDYCLFASGNNITHGYDMIVRPELYSESIIKCEFVSLDYPHMSSILYKWNIFSNTNEIIDLYLKLDGDYLYVYKNEINEKNFLYRLIRGNRNTYDEICNFVKTGNYDKSNIIWPHHADGTSEYEDTIRYPGEEVNNNSSNDSESNDEEFSQEFLDWLSGKEYETQEQSEDDSKEKNEEIYKINKIQILFFFIIIIIFSIIIIKIIIQKNKKKRQ